MRIARPSQAGVLNKSQCTLLVEAVRKFGSIRLRVSGASMVPAIRPGDLVTVESVGVEDVSPGEIVVFALAGRLVCHRVTAISGSAREPLLATRGDRARRDDPLISNSELLGRVSHIDRGRRSVPLRTRLTAAEQMICRLLRISDRATSLYLRVTAL
jgi:signal peptidase I